jgi:hypothetical protein
MKTNLLKIGIPITLLGLWVITPMIKNYCDWKTAKPTILLKEQETHTAKEFAAGENYLKLIKTPVNTKQFLKEMAAALQEAHWGFDQENYQLYFANGTDATPNSKKQDRTIPIGNGKSIMQTLAQEAETELAQNNVTEAKKKIEAILITGTRVGEQKDISSTIIGQIFIKIAMDSLEKHPELKTATIEKELKNAMNAPNWVQNSIAEDYNYIKRSIENIAKPNGKITWASLLFNPNTYTEFERDAKETNNINELLVNTTKKLLLEGQFLDRNTLKHYHPNFENIQKIAENTKERSKTLIASNSI